MRPTADDERLDALEYPLTTAELLAAAGDVELTLPNGSETLGEAVGRLGDQRFDTPEDVRVAIRTGVGAAAIGRRYYSDRDPPTGQSNYQQLSF